MEEARRASTPIMRRERRWLFVNGSGPSRNPAHARLIDDPDLQIVSDPDLAGEPNVFGEARLHRQTVALKLTNLSWVARQHFHTARSTFRISTAAMQNIN